MRQKYYYKVTDANDKSIMGCHLPDEYVIQYLPGLWVKPNIDKTKIMVFNNVEDARKFATEKDKVWKCEVYNPNKKGLFIPFVGSLPRQGCGFEDMMKLLQQMRRQKKKMTSPYIWYGGYYSHETYRGNKSCYLYAPAGTVFVDSIKLVEQINK